MISVEQLDKVAPAPQYVEGMSSEWDNTFAEALAESGPEYGLHVYSTFFWIECMAATVMRLQ